MPQQYKLVIVIVFQLNLSKETICFDTLSNMLKNITLTPFFRGRGIFVIP